MSRLVSLPALCLAAAMALPLSTALMVAPASAQVADRPDDFVELTKKVSPAVVNISTAQKVDVKDSSPFGKDSPLERFNDLLGNGNGSGISNSLGSGFVIDAKGFIVTNNHVIEDADDIEVTFPNGENYTAELIGRDPETDLALLKIEGSGDFPFVPFAADDSAQVGEWVIAIGNPFGYGGSVAAGIVSARNRNISHGSYDDFIQTDVAINKGNSGGPLFNLDGEVVGVNTAILSTTGFSAGISFSIPSDLTQSVIAQLREYGETRRGYLGVRAQKVTKDTAESYGLDDVYGALVQEIISDSPADEAGLIQSDLVTHINGQRVKDNRALYRMVADLPIGKPVEFDYVRKRKPRSTMVTVTRKKEKVKRVDKLRKDSKTSDKGETVLGITVVELTEDTRREKRLPMGAGGVLVTEVSKKSDAAGKVQVGDVIEEIELEAVQTPAQFKERMEEFESENRPITILINRNGNPVFYAIRTES